MLAICPKLRTFKLWVTGAGEGEQLAELGATLRSLGHTLDQITLVYPPHTDTLPGFQVSTLLVFVPTTVQTCKLICLSTSHQIQTKSFKPVSVCVRWMNESKT